MLNNDYRTMFNEVIGPIINYFGFHMNPDGIIQQINGKKGITVSGKHLYVPTDGYDYFRMKDSIKVVPFNPFKIREHILVLSNFFCKALDAKFRDEDDIVEYNSSGEVISIVELTKRSPNSTDGLPATFNGVIYEIICRDESDVLGKGIDADGNDIKAIIMAMWDVLSKYTHLVDKSPNYEKLFNYVQRVESHRDLEIDDARAAASNITFDQGESNADVAIDDSEFDSSDDEEDSDDTSSHGIVSMSLWNENPYDEIEFN